MGFECGFYKMPRFKNVTGNQVAILSSYFRWQDYYQDKFTFEQYRGHSESESPDEKAEENQILKDKEAIDFYRPLMHDTGYGSIGLIDTVDFWCSIGRRFNDWFIEHCNDGVDDCKLHNEFTKDLMIDALKYVQKYLDENHMQEWNVVNAFRENEETGEKTIIPLDGIEIENEDGLIKRIYSEYDTIFYNPGFDDEEYNAYSRLKDVLINMIINTDFEKEMVYYFTSW